MTDSPREALATEAAEALTVVTVTLNDLAGLQATTASIAAQSHRDAHHVIVDGGSTDGSLAWLAELPSAPNRVVISEPDDGIYDAMNKGLRRAPRGLVTFLNAGDTYLHESVLAHAWARWTDQRWTWGFGRASVVDEGGRQVRRLTAARYSRLRHAFGRNTIVHQTIFFERDALLRLGGFDVRYSLAADFHRVLTLGRTTPPAVWPTVDVAYMVGGASDRSPDVALREMHLARCDALGFGPVACRADAAWARVLMFYVQGRKQTKLVARRLLGDQAVVRWVNGRTSSR